MMQHANSDQALLATTMKNAFQLGVFSRASRLLMQCEEFDDFCHHATETLEEVGLSGRIKLSCGEENRQVTFGNGIRPVVFSSLSGLDRCKSKICSGSTFFIFNTRHVLLILDTEDTDAVELDLLTDNLTIYMDTIHHWLDQQQRISEERVKNGIERSKVITNLRSFVECVTRLSQHLTETQQAVNEDLLTQLISVFPVMGMEADQEEIILNIVNDARGKERTLMEQQLRQNDDLRFVMKQAIDALLASNANAERKRSAYSDNAGVTLF